MKFRWFINRKTFLAWLLLLVGGAPFVYGQSFPLLIGNSRPVLDEFGLVLPGYEGHQAAMVHLLWASNNLIFPPYIDGDPHLDNQPVEGSTAWIGSLTTPVLTNSGLFVVAILTNKPPVGSKFFVRVYNRANNSDATFYIDSPVYSVTGDRMEVQLSSSVLPINPADDDGDGVNNSWEKSLGSDPEITDSDSDGMDDGLEFRAGTGLSDPASFLAMRSLRTINQFDADVLWQSISGKQYQVEYAEGHFGNEAVFSNVGEIVSATGSWCGVTMIGGMTNTGGTYRIRLVE